MSQVADMGSASHSVLSRRSQFLDDFPLQLHL